MNNISVDELASLIVGGISAVVTVLGALILGYVKIAAKLREAISQAAAGRTAAEVTAREVTPNHGSSMNDALRRIESSLNTMRIEVNYLSDDVKETRLEMRTVRQTSHETHKELYGRLRALESANKEER